MRCPDPFQPHSNTLDISVPLSRNSQFYWVWGGVTDTWAWREGAVRNTWGLCQVQVTPSYSDMHPAPLRPKFLLTVSPVEALVDGDVSYHSSVLGEVGKTKVRTTDLLSNGSPPCRFHRPIKIQSQFGNQYQGASFSLCQIRKLKKKPLNKQKMEISQTTALYNYHKIGKDITLIQRKVL